MKGKGLYPGCLAMIVGTSCKENNGLVVTCVALLKTGDKIGDGTTSGRDGWHVHNEEGRLLVSFHKHHCGGPLLRKEFRKDGVMSVCYLLPLGGPDLAVDTDTAKPKEVPTKEDVF